MTIFFSAWFWGFFFFWFFIYFLTIFLHGFDHSLVTAYVAVVVIVVIIATVIWRDSYRLVPVIGIAIFTFFLFFFSKDPAQVKLTFLCTFYDI